MNNSKITIGVVVILVLLVGAIMYSQMKISTNSVVSNSTNASEVAYNPKINPSDFTNAITNPYFTLPVGRKLTYEGVKGTNKASITIEIVPETKMIVGVKTAVYHDRVYVSGQLAEDTIDYLAQDKEGNVWYFGEEVNNFEGGKLKDHHGTWIAGQDGAVPGIWIKAKPVVGDSFKQEYYKDKAEDMSDVAAVDQTVKTKLATYTGCVKMYDWTPLDSKSKEYKYYCPKVGALVSSESLTGGEKVELTKVINP